MMFVGIAITSYDAIKRLREVGARFTIQDDGSIVTETPNNGYKRKRTFHPCDTIGSLYDRDTINNEVIYWQCRNQRS